MSSFYDGQPPPPKRPPLAAQAKAAADRYVPLFYDPSYDEKPASKRPEFLVIGVVVIIGVLVFTWALSVFNGDSLTEARESATRDLAVRQSFQDEQAYDNIIANPYGSPNADWNLDGVTDALDVTYFEEIVYFQMPYEAVLELAPLAAASTYPEIAAERQEQVEPVTPICDSVCLGLEGE